jgi:hypothetical protein
MKARRFLDKYLAINVITLCSFKGREVVCFGILPGCEGEAKAT